MPIDPATGDERASALRDASAHVLARAIHVAAELRLADLIGDGRVSSAKLARASGTDPRALQRLLHFLARHGYFEEGEDGDFSSTARGAMLRSDAPQNGAAVIRSLGHSAVWDAFGALLTTVRTGAPPAHRKDRRLYASEIGAEGARRRSSTMIGYHAGEPELVARAWDFSKAKTVVDVGGNSGRLLTTIMECHHHLHGIVFDRPEMETEAKAAIAAAGLGDRCAFVGGNFFEAVPAGADTYMLSHVLHDWSDADAAAILACCRRAMGTGASLLIIEALVEADGLNESYIPADLLLLANSEGRLRSARDYERLLAGARFRIGRISRHDRKFSILEARASI